MCSKQLQPYRNLPKLRDRKLSLYKATVPADVLAQLLQLCVLFLGHLRDHDVSEYSERPATVTLETDPSMISFRPIQ